MYNIVQNTVQTYDVVGQPKAFEFQIIDPSSTQHKCVHYVGLHVHVHGTLQVGLSLDMYYTSCQHECDLQPM